MALPTASNLFSVRIVVSPFKLLMLSCYQLIQIDYEQQTMTNTWLEPSNNEQEEFYTSHANKIIVERLRASKILSDLLRYHFKEVSNLKILDLGCGDGALTRNLSQLYPDNEFHLIDGSAHMLTRARENLKSDCFHFSELRFDMISSACENRQYNVIFSSNAIHHLTYDEKGSLYSTIYDKLDWGGIFINIDFVLPESDVSEKWQFTMWVDWINENLTRLGLSDEVHQYDDIPQRYKDKDENRPGRLFDQLTQLKRSGFNNVDCVYKYGVNAIFAGTK